MIYRLTEAEDWRAALVSGQFASADLVREGFIHCSQRAQILATANRYYAGKTHLILLQIDAGQIAESIKNEYAPHRAEWFPHVYAPIPLRAIVAHFDFLADAEGRFVLPAALAA